MNPNICEDTISVNEKSHAKRIIRVVHNKENPFVMLNKQALWDERLSLRAVGLWVRCMSRHNNWKFNISELIKHCKEGQDAIYASMNELIEFGYAIRLQFRQKKSDGKYCQGYTEYIFFEFPASEEEKAFHTEEFKKSFQHRDFHDRGFQDRGNPSLLIHTNTKIDLKKYSSPPIPPQSPSPKSSNKIPTSSVEAKASEDKFSDPQKPLIKKTKTYGEYSPEVQQLAEKMITSLHEANPHWHHPKHIIAVLQEVEDMISKEKRTSKDIWAVYFWAINDSFWMDKFCKPNPAKYLRTNFAQLAAKMNAKPKTNPYEVDRRIKNKDGVPYKDNEEFVFI